MQTPAAFEYERATSVEGVIASLQRLGPEARIIAGGHSLLPMMKLRLANPEYLIDINDLTELAYIREQDGEIRIGALTRHVDLLKSELLAERFPLFRDAEKVIADPVVRNRGTIGGSLCQADAAEDLSAVCTAAKAHAVIRGAEGERVVGMEDFHVGPYMTAVGAAEMLTEVRLEVRPGAGSAHEKVERRAGDWAIAAASAAVWIDDGTIGDVGIALSAVGLTTVHLTRAEELLRGQAPTEELFAQAGEIASADCSPSADGRGPVDYKRHLAGVLTQRALRRATARALRSGGLIINVSMTVNGEHVSHDSRAAPAARPLHPRDARADRHPLGLRHLQLRRLRGADRRPAGQVVHDPGGDVRRARRSARSSRSRSTGGSTRSSRASTSCTPCSAGSARRAC